MAILVFETQETTPNLELRKKLKSRSGDLTTLNDKGRPATQKKSKLVLGKSYEIFPAAAKWQLMRNKSSIFIFSSFSCGPRSAS